MIGVVNDSIDDTTKEPRIMPKMPIDVPRYIIHIATQRQMPVADAVHHAFGHWQRANLIFDVPPGHRLRPAEVRRYRKDATDVAGVASPTEHVIIVQAEREVIVSVCVGSGPWHAFPPGTFGDIDPDDDGALITAAVALYRKDVGAPVERVPPVVGPSVWEWLRRPVVEVEPRDEP
jgi:hypothetical protein